MTPRRAILSRPRPTERASLSLTQRAVRSEDVYSRYESLREAARRSSVSLVRARRTYTFYANIPGGIQIFFGIINNPARVESGTSRLDAIQHAGLFCETSIDIPDIPVVQFRSLFIKQSRDCVYTRPLYISILGAGSLSTRIMRKGFTFFFCFVFIPAINDYICTVY